jgi:hypothetical protein
MLKCKTFNYNNTIRAFKIVVQFVCNKIHKLTSLLSYTHTLYTAQSHCDGNPRITKWCTLLFRLVVLVYTT